MSSPDARTVGTGTGSDLGVSWHGGGEMAHHRALGDERVGDDRRIEMNVGYPCNNSCVFCSEETHRRSPVFGETQRMLTTQFLKRQLVLWRKEGYNHLTFVGGEPTIRKDFLDLMEVAGKCKYRTVFMTTNGRKMADPAYAAALFERGLTHVSFSLHGPDAETHDAVVRRPRAFDELVGGMENTKALGRAFRLATVWNSANIHRIDEMYDFVVRHKPVRAYWCFVRPIGEAGIEFDKVVPYYDQVRDALRRVLARARSDRTPLTLANVPLCVMGEENAGFSDELYWKRDVGEVWREIHKFKAIANMQASTAPWLVTKDHFKLKHRKCVDCRFVGVCDGVLKEYAERRGFSEIAPLELLPGTEPVSDVSHYHLDFLLETARYGF